MRKLLVTAAILFPTIVAGADVPLPAFSENKIGTPPLALAEQAVAPLPTLSSSLATWANARVSPRTAKPKVFVSHMPVIEPSKDFDSKMRIVQPDASVDYKMQVITPALEPAK